MKINTFNLQLFAEEGEGQVDTPVENSESTADTPDVDSQAADDGDATDVDYTELFNAINSKAVVNKEHTKYDSIDELIKHVQMGNNTEKVHNQRDEFKNQRDEFKKQLDTVTNSRQAKYMKNFLTENGYESFGDWEDALEISKLVEGGMSEELAKNHIAGQKALTSNNEAKTKAEKEANKQSLDSKNSVDAIDWFKDNGYGELTADKVTQETWDVVNNDGVPLMYALAKQMLGTVKSDVQQDTLKKLQDKKDNSQVAVDSTNTKQVKTVWDMSDADFAKDKERRKRGY